MSDRETASDRKAARRASPLSPRLSVDEAIVVILTSSQAELIAALRATLDRPMPETVHGLRVALHRLRAALAIAERWADTEALHEIQRDAKALSDALRETQDWDTLVATTLERHRKALAGIADVTPLIEGAATARHDGYRRVRALLDGPLPQKLLLGLALVLSQQRWRGDGNKLAKRLAIRVGERAKRDVARADKRLKANGKRIERLADEARHELGAGANSLGHTIDFLEPIWQGSKKIGRYRDRVQALQTSLGALGDAQSTQQLLNRIAEDDLSPAIQRAVGAIAGWSARDKVERLAALEAIWRDFRTAKRFW